MNTQKSIRITNCIGLFFIIILLGTANYVEFFLGMVPCPLCILQRYMMIGIGVMFFLGAIGKWNYCIAFIIRMFGALFSIGGILFAGRQVWLQHIPKEGLGECGASLSYMLKILPLTETVKHVWRGGIECSEQGFVFLNLSLAEWSLIWFVIFFILFAMQQRKVGFTCNRAGSLCK